MSIKRRDMLIVSSMLLAMGIPEKAEDATSTTVVDYSKGTGCDEADRFGDCGDPNCPCKVSGASDPFGDGSHEDYKGWGLVATSSEFHELADEDYKAICKLCRDVQTLMWNQKGASYTSVPKYPNGVPMPNPDLPQPVLSALQSIVSLLDEISWWGVRGMPCPDGATSDLFDMAVRSSSL